MGDDSVIIDIELNIKDNTTGKISSDLDHLKIQLKNIQNRINENSSKFNEEGKIIIQNLVRPIADTIREMERLNSETNAYKKSLAGLSNIRARMGKVLKGGKDKGITEQFGEVTKEKMQELNNTIAKQQGLYAASNSKLKELGATASKFSDEEFKALYTITSYLTTANRRGYDFLDVVRMTNTKFRDIVKSEEDAVEKTKEYVQAQIALRDSTSEQSKQQEKIAAVSEKSSKSYAKNTGVSTAQTYYLVRALKMLGFTLKNTEDNVNKVSKKLVAFVTSPITATKRLVDSFKKLSAHLKQVKSTSDKANHSLGIGFKNILKYTLGIRSLFVLFNRLRAAMVEGLQQMALRESYVNKELSSIYTSLYYMKSSIATAVQPLLKSLAPALEYISELFAKATYYVGSFFAELTGQDFVYKSIRKTVDYAKDIAGSTGSASDNLEDAEKNADKLKKQLSGLDKLNVLTTQEDKDKEDKSLKPGYGWEQVPLDEQSVRLARDLKRILGELFDPIKEAWDKKGKFVMDSWSKALKSIQSLIITIGKDFLTMWADEETEKVFEDIFQILGDIGLIVANLSTNFESAWSKNKTGLSILRSIRDVIASIVKGLRECADYTVRWSSGLDFYPILSTIASVLKEQIKPAIKDVVDLLEYLYKNILLTIIEDTVEKGLPKILSILGNITQAIGNIASNIETALSKGNMGEIILKDVENLLNIITNHILSASAYTVKWAENLDFTNLLESLDRMLVSLKEPVESLSSIVEYFFNNIVLGFIQYLVETGIPKVMDAVGRVSAAIDWDLLEARMKKLIDALGPFLSKVWEALVIVFEDLGKAISNIVNSDAFGKFIDMLVNWMENASPEEMAKAIEHLGLALIGMKVGLGVLKTFVSIGTNLGTLITAFKNLKQVWPIVSGFKGKVVKAFTGLANEIPVQVQGVSAALKGMSDSAAFMAEGVLGVIAGMTLNLGAFFTMLQNGFTVSGEIVMTLGAAITAVGLIILGVPGIVAGVIAGVLLAVENFVIAVSNYPKEFGEKINEIGETIGKIPEFFEKAFSKAKEFIYNLGGKLGTAIRETIPKVVNNFKDFPKQFKIWAKTVDWKELGINILKGILYIFLLPARLAVFILEAVGNFFKGFIDGLTGKFKIKSPSKVMIKYGEYIVQGLFKGIKDTINSYLTKIGNWFEKIITKVKKIFGIASPSTKFEKIGKNIVQGLLNGIKERFATAKEKIDTMWPKILNSAKKVLEGGQNGVGRLYNTGRNLVTGLYNGIVQRFNEVWSKITDMWSRITEGARKVFNEHSPSKVFYQIGAYLTEGLVNGIEGESDSVPDAFESMIPDTNYVESFADNFISVVADMKDASISLVDTMMLRIEESFKEMQDMTNRMQNMYDNMNKLSNVSVPKMAQGFVIPSNMKFVNSNTNTNDIDFSELPGIIKDAVIEALLDPSVMTNDSDDDIIIQIDGKNIFNAVRSQNDVFKKRTGGVSAFA